MHSAPPTQRLFTPDRLLPSFWADLTDREGAERQKCDGSRAEMGLESCKDKEIGCDARDTDGQHMVKCKGVGKEREGVEKEKGVDNTCFA